MGTPQEVLQRQGAEQLFRVLQAEDPAAGANVSFTVPGGMVWEIQTLRFSLVTNAVVANRRVGLIIDDGERTLFESEADATQAASLTRTYQYVSGLGYKEAAFAEDVLSTGIPLLFLSPGFRVRTSVTAIDAGDNIGAPILYVYERVYRSLASQIAYELAVQLQELGELERYGL